MDSDCSDLQWFFNANFAKPKIPNYLWWRRQNGAKGALKIRMLDHLINEGEHLTINTWQSQNIQNSNSSATLKQQLIQFDNGWQQLTTVRGTSRWTQVSRPLACPKPPFPLPLVPLLLRSRVSVVTNCLLQSHPILLLITDMYSAVFEKAGNASTLSVSQLSQIPISATPVKIHRKQPFKPRHQVESISIRLCRTPNCSSSAKNPGFSIHPFCKPMMTTLSGHWYRSPSNGLKTRPISLSSSGTASTLVLDSDNGKLVITCVCFWSELI